MLEIFPRYVQSNHYLNKTKKQAEMRETWTFRHHSVTITDNTTLTTLGDDFLFKNIFGGRSSRRRAFRMYPAGLV